MRYQSVGFLRACPECHGSGLQRSPTGSSLGGYPSSQASRCSHCGGGGRIEGFFDAATRRICYRRLDTGQPLQVPVPAESPLIPLLAKF